MIDLMRILSVESGLSENDLRRIIATAPRRYKVFNIPKRNGGVREIAQPAREVKLLQRILVNRILINLPIHRSAMAYRKGFSIRDNASNHAGHSPILKMDFQDFFPSIRSADWEAYCHEHNLLAPEDRYVSSQILFRKKKGESTLKLSIGAPSSPMICNILLFQFDKMVTLEAERRKINFTRYADDLTFSGQRIGMLKDMLKVVDEAVRMISFPSLTINKEKTTFVTTSRRRTVTGVILANSGNLSFGHERKRVISSQVHHAKLGKLTVSDLAALAGQLAFINVIEPEFIARLRARYGDETINKIQHAIIKND